MTDNLLSLVKELVVSGMRVNNNSTVMTCALVNFSPWLRICSWLELRGKWTVSYIPQLREEQMVRICLYVCMCGSTHDCGCVVNGSGAMAAL